MICDLCPRMCHAERSERAGAGRCGMGTLPVIARAAAHFGEEPCLSGVRGSGAVFFCGCPLHCVFCQNDEISRAGARGKTVTPEELLTHPLVGTSDRLQVIVVADWAFTKVVSARAAYSFEVNG